MSMQASMAARSDDKVVTAAWLRWIRGAGLQWLLTGLLAILVLAPLIPMVVQAFASAPLYDSSWAFTLDNVIAFVTSSEVLAVTGNTLIFAIGSTAIALVIGAIAAVLIGKTDLPMRHLLGELFMLPLYLSHLVLGIGFLTMYAPGGFVTTWAQMLGLPAWDLYSLHGMAIVAGIAQAPLVYMYCLYGAAGSSGASLEDAARTAGAGKLRVLFSISIPMMVPALTYSAVLNLVAGMEMLAIPRLLGRTSNIDTLSSYLYRVGIDSPNPNHGFVANAAFLLMILVGISLYLQWRLLRDAFKYTTVGGKAGRVKRIALGKWSWPVAILVLLYATVTTLVPVGGVVLRAFTTILTPLVPVTNVLTLRHITRAFEEPRFLKAIINTIEVGVLCAVIGTAFCVALVFVSQRSNFRFRVVTDALAILPRALPGIIIGLGVFYAAILFPPFGWVRSTIWILVIAYLMNLIPLGVGVIAPAALQVSRELDKAGRTSGADWLRTNISIVLPLLKPAMMGCLILLFIASLKSYAIAMFLFSANTEVIGASILMLAGDGDTGLACALATIQIIFTLAIVFGARRLMGVRIYG